MKVLENDALRICIDNKGAELMNIFGKAKGIEYLWSGDSKFWGRKAPILFPIVGMLRDNTCTISGENYSMTQHGFARDSYFDIYKENESSIEYEIKSNNETLKKFPYSFTLRVGYVLEENQIIVSYRVMNDGKVDMFFSIGAHPGFNCPLLKGETLEDYYLEFEKEESIDRYILHNGIVQNNKVEFLKGEKLVHLTKDIFKDDAIILKDTRSNSISLKNHKNSREVTIDYTGFPYLGIWSPTSGAPFVCIEPWYGIADFEDKNESFEQKVGINKLSPGKDFQCEFKIIIK